MEVAVTADMTCNLNTRRPSLDVTGFSADQQGQQAQAPEPPLGPPPPLSLPHFWPHLWVRPLPAPA